MYLIKESHFINQVTEISLQFDWATICMVKEYICMLIPYLLCSYFINYKMISSFFQ